MKRKFLNRFGLISVWVLLSSCAQQRAEPSLALARYEFERPEMGVPFRIILYAPGPELARTAADAAYDRVSQLNNIMSDYDPDSELSLLSRTSGSGKAVPVSPDLWRVLERAQDLAQTSHGAFDITVGPYVTLWRQARRERRLPTADKLTTARQSVGYDKVKLLPRIHSVQLIVPGMRLDLGGIAKGYAADEALKALRKHGVSRALIEAGGDSVVGDPPPGARGWRIQISPLDATNSISPGTIALRNAAISTSGDLYQRLEINGVRYSHIVDPRTGIGLTDHRLVNVIAKDGITADSLTKVLSVMEPQSALKFIEKIPGVAGRIVRDPSGNIETYETRRFSYFYLRNR
jgi:thiamine biosynthesis lipoprotein